MNSFETTTVYPPDNLTSKGGRTRVSGRGSHILPGKPLLMSVERRVTMHAVGLIWMMTLQLLEPPEKGTGKQHWENQLVLCCGAEYPQWPWEKYMTNSTQE